VKGENLLRLAVIQQSKAAAAETGNRPARLIGYHNIELDEAHSRVRGRRGALAERRSLRRGCCCGLRRGKSRQAEKQNDTYALWNVHRLDLAETPNRCLARVVLYHSFSKADLSKSNLIPHQDYMEKAGSVDALDACHFNVRRGAGHGHFCRG
jgi:hypothetical protein